MENTMQLPTDTEVEESLRAAVEASRTPDRQTEVRMKQVVAETLAPAGVATAMDAMRASMNRHW